MTHPFSRAHMGNKVHHRIYDETFEYKAASLYL